MRAIKHYTLTFVTVGSVTTVASGTIQELHNLGIKQFLTVIEPARLKGSIVGGQYNLVMNGGVGFTYDVQSSSNLVDWRSLTIIQTTNMTMPVLSLDAAQE